MMTGKPMIAHVHATQYDQSAGGYGNPEVREIEYNCTHDGRSGICSQPAYQERHSAGIRHQP
jgi:hypothetical protein